MSEEPSPLLRLPAELRNEIWQQIERDSIPWTDYPFPYTLYYPSVANHLSSDLPPILPITQVNRQLRKEASSILYADVHFSLEPRPKHIVSTISHWLAAEVPHWAKYAKTVTVTVPFALDSYSRRPDFTLKFVAEPGRGFFINADWKEPKIEDERLEMMCWLQMACEQLKEVMVGALAGGTIELHEEEGSPFLPF
ncbi:unnamed protein product [Zymoseptoria tritici ST99CH_3D7]|uniref:F-box domain-containing protein n=1 Tax=Zymoseptoria tritici (strain ST99CH_3D7) TaxID=1276538 RepID=A0A1X7S0V7_ZYMT9|nr:unnamed protein product [Zymoseptoria tritici ST99CH_3D7]